MGATETMRLRLKPSVRTAGTQGSDLAERTDRVPSSPRIVTRGIPSEASRTARKHWRGRARQAESVRVRSATVSDQGVGLQLHASGSTSHPIADNAMLGLKPWAVAAMRAMAAQDHESSSRFAKSAVFHPVCTVNPRPSKKPGSLVTANSCRTRRSRPLSRHASTSRAAIPLPR